MELEHAPSRFWPWQGNVYPLLEPARRRAQVHEIKYDGAQPSPSLYSVIQLPWDVGRAEDEDAGIVVADAVHLDEELGLDSS